MGFENFIKKSYPHLATSKPANGHELSRQFGRNISLLLISDEFEGIEEVMALVQALKERRKNEVIPVLFLTRNHEKLVYSYNKNLAVYHETDNYIQYSGKNPRVLYAQIKNCIENKNPRRSRRYKINIPGYIFHLTSGKKLPITIVDLSVHGGMIAADTSQLFRENEQLLLIIPTTNHLSLTSGEFLKLSAKVRRVYISGSTVGISFEHVSEGQYYNLTTFLTNVVTNQLERKSSRMQINWDDTDKKE